MIHSAPLIAHRPIDATAIARAGAPGDPRRAIVAEGLLTLDRTRAWRAGGRGPDAYDWLGFVRHCVTAGREDAWPGYGPPDLDSASPITPADACDLFLAWGLARTHIDGVSPGDAILFDIGGEAHAGVIIDQSAARGRRLAHFRAGGSTRLAPFDGDGAWRAFAAAAFRPALH